MYGSRRKPGRRNQARRGQEQNDGFSALLTAQTAIVAVSIIAIIAVRAIDGSPQLESAVNVLISGSDAQLVSGQLEEFGKLFDNALEVFAAPSIGNPPETGLAGTQDDMPEDSESIISSEDEAADSLEWPYGLDLGSIEVNSISFVPQAANAGEGEPYYLSVAPVWPVVGSVTSEFGSRVHPILKTNDFHKGVDIAASYGSDISSAFSGVVEAVGYDDIYGNHITIRQSESMITRYCHCSEIIAKEGDAVKAGDVIAKVGSSGMTTGAHLHFEIEIFSVKVNPMRILV